VRHTLAALRVLVVTSVPPLPEGGAAARCALGLLRGLEIHGIEAHVLCSGDPQAIAGPLPGGLSVELVPLPVRPRWLTRWDRLVAPMGRLARAPFATRLGERAREADVVHFVEAEAAVAMDAVQAPALVQLHCLTRRDPRVWNPLRAAGRVSIELLRAELKVRRRARWLLANSQEVAQSLAAAAPNAEVVAAPLALDPSHYAPPASLAAPVAGLIGTARWPATASAVERLIDSVWPLVLERRSDARLLLAGEGMERATFPRLAERAGVEWRGPVASASAFLRELGVLLYPLTAGSGAKVKVLEALALGVPVVTTRGGAEGIVGRGGVSVETDDLGLASAAAALLGDSDARRIAGGAALATFSEHHTPASATAPVIELYERMLA
jgi:glycosyltransferase involved in cell wall biosynthesis